MADNYLEKKMEDLRNGKLTLKNHTSKKINNNPYNGLRVFVTGGANGIGRTIVEELRRLKCKVAFCDNDKESGENLASVYGAEFYYLDVTDEKALSSVLITLLDKWKDIDVIVNNVGIGDFKPFTECTLSDFEKVLKTNLFPVFITCNQLARHKNLSMCKSNTETQAQINNYGGRIINISSTRHIQSEEGTEAYAASKGAIFSMTHALMMSLRKFNITVNSISPGWINTGDLANMAPSDLKQHPSNRVGSTHDIARMVAFLIHPDNTFINGQDIVVDGGMTKQMIYSGDNGWQYTT